MNFKERITQMREAAQVPEPTPGAEPEQGERAAPEPEFTDPVVALEDARDQLGEIRRELEEERQRRLEAERKLTATSRPSLQQAFRKRTSFK